jgi:hypothetical protein
MIAVGFPFPNDKEVPVKLFTIPALGLLLFGSACVKEWGEANQKGLDAAKEAKKIAAASPWQKPTNEMVVAAIRTFETGKTDVQTADVVTMVPADQPDRYVVRANINGEERTYLLARDAAGTWTASDKLE